MTDPANLREVLDRISETATGRPRVTLGAIIDTVGRRSYGPVLMIIGILLFSPLSGIPGVPTLSGLLILFISVQMLVLSGGFWLPELLMNRSLPTEKLLRGIRFIEPAAEYVDARLHPRLVLVVRRPGSYLLGGVCVLIACAMPLMEIILLGHRCWFCHCGVWPCHGVTGWVAGGIGADLHGDHCRVDCC